MTRAIARSGATPRAVAVRARTVAVMARTVAVMARAVALMARAMAPMAGGVAALRSIAVVVVVVAGVGCTQRTELLPPLDLGMAPPACSGLGAPILIGGSNGPCAGALAASTVNRAICSCDSIELAGSLFTQATSGAAPGQMGGGGGGGGGLPPPGNAYASVASDGNIEIVGSTEVSGSISAGGTGGIGFNRSAQILGDLRSAGNLAVTQIASVAGDAYVVADVAGRVDVLGTLFVSPASTVSLEDADNNHIVAQPIEVAPPCNCAAGPVVDVLAVVAAAAAHNDDASAGLDATALAKTHGPTSFTLPCGSYYLPSLTTDDTLAVHVQGRSALYIGGDVSLADGLRVTLDEGAELDLFVAGDVSVSAGAVGATTAAAVRLWLASSTVQLGADATLSAIIYAPNAAIVPDDALNATGALFVGSLATVSDVSVRFDASVLADGAACGQATVAPPL